MILVTWTDTNSTNGTQTNGIQAFSNDQQHLAETFLNTLTTQGYKCKLILPKIPEFPQNEND